MVYSLFAGFFLEGFLGMAETPIDVEERLLNALQHNDIFDVEDLDDEDACLIQEPDIRAAWPHLSRQARMVALILAGQIRSSNL